MTDAELTADFWTRLRADRIVMLGLEERRPTHLRPMTAHVERATKAEGGPDHDPGPLWFFSATTADLVSAMAAQDLALFTFVSKDAVIHATVHCHLTLSRDRAVIDRLWSPELAAWYPGGPSDPALALLRFDPVSAEIWRDATGPLAGPGLLFGFGPKARPKGDAAKIALT